jgi:hypothetical protein
VDKFYKAGRFTFTRLGSAWEVQAHILANGGAVVTRLEVYSDLHKFFAKQPKGVYPGPGINVGCSSMPLPAEDLLQQQYCTSAYRIAARKIRGSSCT